MLKRIHISNFRCYVDSTINFNGSSLLVGKNNAGKSTLIEALKIVSSVTRKYKTLRFQDAPAWVPEENSWGVCPNVENMNISDRGIFNMYGNPPAIIEALFVNGTSIKAYVGEELSVFAVIYDSDGYAVRNGREAKEVDIPVIEVLPQISAVLDNEKLIKKVTVDSNRSTRLASRNFRNQLYYYSDCFPKFKELVESTWETLRVNPIESSFVDGGTLLQFFVRVNSFEAEIGWMGHGLQMWVQTMWFISQCPSNAIVVLDEPDVYMHADMQRRLVRLLSPMFSQLIIATHSLEIIEEVPSESLVPINSQNDLIKPIGEVASLQTISEILGNPLNIDLARIFISPNFLIFNSDESGRKMLSSFQSVLYPTDLHAIITFPKAYVKGKQEWLRIKTIGDILSSSEININVICLLEPNDIDNARKNRMLQESAKNNINLHIWNQKEIDNYAISPDAITRYIQQNMIYGEFSQEIVAAKIKEICERLKVEFTVKIAEQLSSSTSYGPDVNILTEAKKLLDSQWPAPYGCISGRQFFKEFSIWTKECFGIQITPSQVASCFFPHEVPNEIKEVISRILGK